MTALSSLIYTLAIMALAATANATTFASALRRTRNPIANRDPPQHREMIKKSNDVGHVIVPLMPFFIHMNNIPFPGFGNSSNYDIGGNSGGNRSSASGNMEEELVQMAMDIITTIGTTIFIESSEYGERFEGWDLGNLWTSEFFPLDNDAVDGIGNERDQNDGKGSSHEDVDGDVSLHIHSFDVDGNSGSGNETSSSFISYKTTTDKNNSINNEVLETDDNESIRKRRKMQESTSSVSALTSSDKGTAILM